MGTGQGTLGDNKLNKKARVRIADRGWNNRDSSSGIGLSQTVLKDFFGFDPQFNGKVIRDDISNWPFNGAGKLHHVNYNGQYYTIEFENDCPVMIREAKEY